MHLIPAGLVIGIWGVGAKIEIHHAVGIPVAGHKSVPTFTRISPGSASLEGAEGGDHKQREAKEFFHSKILLEERDLFQRRCREGK